MPMSEEQTFAHTRRPDKHGGAAKRVEHSGVASSGGKEGRLPRKNQPIFPMRHVSGGQLRS